MAEAFVKYLFTPETQREFAKIGLPSSEKSL
jgi:ABC-type sulfate transport system substrate-binding protein